MNKFDLGIRKRFLTIRGVMLWNCFPTRIVRANDLISLKMRFDKLMKGIMWCGCLQWEGTHPGEPEFPPSPVFQAAFCQPKYSSAVQWFTRHLRDHSILKQDCLPFFQRSCISTYTEKELLLLKRRKRGRKKEGKEKKKPLEIFIGVWKWGT